ncbi:MAG: hypothetical protein FJW34_14880 [Acidobacteria bacterium]|nr:hypothetical protein [Acidobacteriota bacterium]
MRCTIPLIGLAALALAADKKPPSGQVENERVAIAATLYAGKEAVRQELGAELHEDFLLVKVSVAPKAGQELAVHRDDFLLRSDKDGQRCQPFAPTQIAGPVALVISQGGGRGGIMSEDRGPVWGGIGGPPRRMGNEGASMGSVDQGSVQAGLSSDAKQKENPALVALRAKAMPEKPTAEPVSGLLYFQLEGKHKPKDLELRYNGPAGKISLRFRQ